MNEVLAETIRDCITPNDPQFAARLKCPLFGAAIGFARRGCFICDQCTDLPIPSPSRLDFPMPTEPGFEPEPEFETVDLEEFQEPREDARGCLMTKQEFIDAVRCGGYVDYDGYGNYAMIEGDKVKILKDRDQFVVPSRIKRDGWNDSFSHLIWYNR